VAQTAKRILSHYDVAGFEVFRGGRIWVFGDTKTTHWMWFIFPQLAGLGASDTARHYALSGEDAARAYLHHPVLGARLKECAEAMLAAPGDSATAILGTPDDLKLRSCATLFARVAGPGSVFERLLVRFFGGVPDARTQALLDIGAYPT
jgi:uncharacterized protein (DUF1810 family)